MYDEIHKVMLNAEEDEINRILDELQASIVLSGGRKIRHTELREMSFRELLKMTLPNGITWKIRPDGRPL